MDDLLRLLTLQDANTRVVLLGVALLGLAAGVVGCFTVLRRRALVGDAVAHSALPGVAIAYFIVGDRSLPAFMLGALATGLVAVACITWIRTYTRVKEDAAIGVVLASFFGLGITLSVIIQHQPEGNRAGLDSFLFGKAASMVRQDALQIAAVAALVLAAVALGYKELKLLCFDRDFAGAIGRPARTLDLALMFLVCVCTVIGLPAVGVVLMVALLIVPAAGARFWTDRLGVMLVIAGIAGALSGLLGASISALKSNLSAGPLIALVAAAFFTVSLLAAPRRGVIASWWRHRELSRRVLVQNLLRALYELDESARGQARLARELALSRDWSRPQLARAVRLAARRALVTTRGDELSLTPAGAAEAAAVLRAHRLWELYLIDHADIAPDHVDRDADALEHVMPPDMLERLEAKLKEQGRLPAAIPSSPHMLNGPRPLP